MTGIMDEIKQKAKATMQGPNGALVPGPGGSHLSAQNNQTLDTEFASSNMGRGFEQTQPGTTPGNQVQGFDLSGMGQAGHMSIGGATGLNDLHTGLPNNNTGLAEAGMGHNQHHSAHMGTGMAAGMGSAMAHPSSGVGSGMGQEHSLSSNALGPGTGYDHSHTYGGVGSGMGPPQSGSTDNNMNQGGSGFGSNGGTIGTGMAHTHASSGMGQHHHSDYQPQGTDAGTASGTGFDASKSGRHGKGIKVSSATKGAEYDATGGAVDDGTAMQKVKDKLTPGSDIGKHTKA